MAAAQNDDVIPSTKQLLWMTSNHSWVWYSDMFDLLKVALTFSSRKHSWNDTGDHNIRNLENSNSFNTFYPNKNNANGKFTVWTC